MRNLRWRTKKLIAPEKVGVNVFLLCLLQQYYIERRKETIIVMELIFRLG
jgi:hypothetical protein